MTGSPGRVKRLDIAERDSPCFGGSCFGDVGAYERQSGRACCEIDPLHPLNAGIVNLDRAARNRDRLLAAAEADQLTIA